MIGELTLDAKGRGVKGSTVDYEIPGNETTNYTLQYDEWGRLIKSVVDNGGDQVYNTDLKWQELKENPENSLLIACQWINDGRLVEDLMMYNKGEAIVNDFSIDLCALLMTSEGWSLAVGDESHVFSILGLLGQKSHWIPATVVSEEEAVDDYVCTFAQDWILISGSHTKIHVELE